jgi:hypothetical protein
LDAEPLDTPGIPMDISMDEIGSSEQGEEIPQQEISISIVDYQVSTKHTPNSSILSINLPLDEKQPEVETSRHT